MVVDLPRLEPGDLILIRVRPRLVFPRLHRWPARTTCRWRPLETAGSDGVWTKRGAAQWSKAGLSVGRCGVAVLEAIGLGPVCAAASGSGRPLLSASPWTADGDGNSQGPPPSPSNTRCR